MKNSKSEDLEFFGPPKGIRAPHEFVCFANRRILCPSHLRQGEPMRDGLWGSNPTATKIKHQPQGLVFCFWPAQRDSNPRSSESESAALSNCATGRNIKFAVSNYSICHCKKQHYFVFAVFRTYGKDCLNLNKILMFFLLEY